ncbi:MAG: ion transporter [Gammaproteobacteria bacterium]|nr:ion transporter [Gammaproteobacteria bacterium]
MARTLDALQRRFIALRSNRLFEFIVIGVILLSALIIGARTYDLQPRWHFFLRFMDIGVTVFFLAEISVRMAAEKRLVDFFKQGWNVFDFLIVSASLIPMEESQTVLVARLLRVFRVLRLVSIVPELRILLNALIKAIPRMGYVAVLMFIIFYIYGAIGSLFFERVNPILWGDIAISMLTLFRVVTFEDWTDVMYETMAVYPLSWIFYLTFIFFTAFVFLNMMIGIVLDVMQTEHEEYNQQQGQGEAGEVRWVKEHTAQIESRLARMENTLNEIRKRA